jgi:RimJ/RimL family protein N-acetyltransferase
MVMIGGSNISMTACVNLKKPGWTDMVYIRALWREEDTMKPVGGPVHLTDDQARRWFEKMIDPGNPGDYYRLIVNTYGQLVGEVSFHRLDRKTMTAELNVKIEHAQRRYGYGKASMRLILDYFFGAFGGRTMVDRVALDNSDGQQALLRFGFVHDSSQTDVFKLVMTRDRYSILYG